MRKGMRNLTRLSETGQDCLFLSLVVLLSLVLYVRSLGFYSDDWSFLGYFRISADQSLPGLFRYMLSPQVQMRPVQVLYLSGLYWLFGFHPLGYHLVNTAVLVVIPLLFYVALRELGQPRIVALAVPIVYVLLPHYSTDRFWIAAIQANLSMALYFLSLYSDARAVRSRTASFWSWKLLGLLSLLGSTLAYEVALPLFLLNLLVVWSRGRQQDGSATTLPGGPPRVFVLMGSNLVALFAVLLFKRFSTIRIGDNSIGFAEYTYWILRRAVALNSADYDAGLNIKRALAVSYGDYGLGLPRVVWKILRDYPDPAVFTLAGLLGLIIFSYLYRPMVHEASGDIINRSTMMKCIATGVVVFALGYAIFLTNYNVIFTPTGIGNRTAIAASVGIALTFVGGMGWLSTFLSARYWRPRVLCALITLLCVSGFLINNTIATFWMVAYRQEQAILTDILQRFPSLPTGSTFILDGICPYIGPAIVFESSWDLRGALMMSYRDQTIRADVVTPDLKVEEDGLSTSLYNVKYHYNYGKLLIYHFGQKKAYLMPHAEAARHYFQTVSPDHGSNCPQAYAGHGVSIF
jgi:hypothetical protein